MPSSNLPPGVLAAEQRARALLGAGKWREARDTVKPLVKLDRERFLPLLIEANVGLARKMMANGQTAEAREVLRYLATVAPPERLRLIELELASKTGQLQRSLPELLAMLADDGAPMSESERVRLVDGIVLAFPSEVPIEPKLAALTAELSAVLEALAAVSHSRWPSVADALRRVPHRSVFSHWAMFIKGIAAFYTGNTHKALKLLSSLPAGSVPAQAAQAYRLLAEEPPAPASGVPVTEPVLEGLRRLTALEVPTAALLRSEKFWKDGRPVDSYKVLREAAASFPSHGLDWQGALSDFYFKALQGMTVSDRGHFLDFLDDLICESRARNPAERMLAHRTFALLETGATPPDDVRAEWEQFLDALERLHGANPRRASLAYERLGERLSMTPSQDVFSTGRVRLRDPQGAIAALRRSIDLDPSNRSAHLQLCAVYEVLKKTGERNRLLDAMTARFPDDKAVLLHAARGCNERKAFSKSLTYLARAREVDRIDPLVLDMTVSTHRLLAQQQFQRRQAQKARETLARIEPFLNDKAEDLQRSRWTTLLRRGLMERVWGDAALSASLLAQGRALAPGPVAHLFFCHLLHRQYAKEQQCESPFLADLRQTLRASATLRDIGQALRVIDLIRNALEPIRTHEEMKMITFSLPAAIKRPYRRDEALQVVERAQRDFPRSQLIRQLVDDVLRADPSDPWFCLWKLEWDRAYGREPGNIRPRLESILAEAGRRGDDAAIRKARQRLADLEKAPQAPGFGSIDDDDDFEDDEIDPRNPLPDLPPEMADQFAAMIEELRQAPESVLQDLREQAIREIPEFVVDALMAIAREGSAPRRKRGAPSRPHDNNQMNLF